MNSKLVCNKICWIQIFLNIMARTSVQYHLCLEGLRCPSQQFLIGPQLSPDFLFHFVHHFGSICGEQTNIPTAGTTHSYQSLQYDSACAWGECVGGGVHMGEECSCDVWGVCVRCVYGGACVGMCMRGVYVGGANEGAAGCVCPWGRGFVRVGCVRW